MHQYGVRDVEKLLKLSRSTIQSLVKAGFVSPARGPRQSYLFSFQDLIVLRTAQALAAAHVSPRRITQSLKQLRRQLPESVPLSGLSICAVADRVVVKEGGSRWQADSGQYLLALDVDPAGGSLAVIERKEPAAEDWFEKGLALESDHVDAALEAYERAIAAKPDHLSAHVNVGLLLHETGRFPEAEAAYRRALPACGGDPVLHYNLGVLLEDMERKEDALAAYEQALRRNPQFADCHYNLALLCEDLDKPAKAIRHMAQYRRLVAGRPD
jgi:tetratricopeptide (TPR) repeat protein